MLSKDQGVSNCFHILNVELYLLICEILVFKKVSNVAIRLIPLTRCKIQFARDEQTGEFRGLTIDVMRKACEMAEKTCVSVFSTDCYDNKKQSSLGRWR